MLGLNQATICGNVGNIDVRYTSNNDPVVNLSIATTEKWKDKNSGQIQEKVEWHRVTLFNGPAKIASEYVIKGDALLVQGKLATRKWTDNSGQNKHTTEIVVSGFEGKIILLGGSKRQAQQPAQQQRPAPARQQPAQQPPVYDTTPQGQQPARQPAQQPVPQNQYGIEDDEIPF